MSKDQFNLTGTSEVKISSVLFATVVLRSIYGLEEGINLPLNLFLKEHCESVSYSAFKSAFHTAYNNALGEISSVVCLYLEFALIQCTHKLICYGKDAWVHARWFN